MSRFEEESRCASERETDTDRRKLRIRHDSAMRKLEAEFEALCKFQPRKLTDAELDELLRNI